LLRNRETRARFLEKGPDPMTPADQSNSAKPAIRCIQFKDSYKALGLAISMLSKIEPYGQYRLNKLVPTLFGEIRRGHYAFAVRGEEVIGYSGWALCSQEVAREWVAGRYKPSYEECVGGICPVLVTFHSKHKAATWPLIRYMRSLYPGQEVFFTRDYAGRKSRDARVLNVG
jgi:hemolysin-activating ACP:hemolysin acyltransferase